MKLSNYDPLLELYVDALEYAEAGARARCLDFTRHAVLVHAFARGAWVVRVHSFARGAWVERVQLAQEKDFDPLLELYPMLALTRDEQLQLNDWIRCQLLVLAFCRAQWTIAPLAEWGLEP